MKGLASGSNGDLVEEEAKSCESNRSPLKNLEVFQKIRKHRNEEGSGNIFCVLLDIHEMLFRCGIVCADTADE